MKNLILLLLVSSLSYAQDNAINKEKMKRLSYLEGKWEGSGWASNPDGSRVEFTQSEDIQLKLDDTILVVEGTGRNPETKEVTFNAFAVFSYDSESQNYSIQSHLATGQSTMASGTFKEEQFIWGFDVPGGKVQYTMTIDGDKWNEYGEFSRDGSQWFKFMEMNLTKK